MHGPFPQHYSHWLTRFFQCSKNTANIESRLCHWAPSLSLTRLPSRKPSSSCRDSSESFEGSSVALTQGFAQDCYGLSRIQPGFWFDWWLGGRNWRSWCKKYPNYNQHDSAHIWSIRKIDLNSHGVHHSYGPHAKRYYQRSGARLVGIYCQTSNTASLDHKQEPWFLLWSSGKYAVFRSTYILAYAEKYYLVQSAQVYFDIGRWIKRLTQINMRG